MSSFSNQIKNLQDVIKSTKNKLILTYISGEFNSEGISWCEDCTNTKPCFEKIKTEYSNKENVEIYSFYLERSYWKDLNNEFRLNSTLKLKRIPTLIAFKNGVELFRKVEGEIVNYEEVNLDLVEAYEH